ncbi:MAG: hypothetical protein OEZ16_07640 [Chromatiales bacterium]|nr:hypothetical protein [Chromatiales bacterium]
MIKRMVVATFVIFAILLFMLPRTDGAGKHKMTSGAMLMCTNDLRKTINKQLQQGTEITARFDNRCPDLVSSVVIDPEGSMTLHGAQYGIVMELSPVQELGEVHWRCLGTPAESITSLCKP